MGANEKKVVEAPGGKARENPSENSDARSLDKVREILVGTHLREIDRRFQEIEKRLADELARMEEAARQRSERLETTLRDGVQSLTEKLAAEVETRKQALADQGQDLRGTLESRFTELARKVAEGEEDLRRQAQSESERLSGDIRRRAEEAAEALRQAVSELTEEKADRGALADLFAEAAERIRQGSPAEPVR